MNLAHFGDADAADAVADVVEITAAVDASAGQVAYSLIAVA